MHAANKSSLILAILSILNLSNETLAATDSNLQTSKQWKLINYNFQPQARVNDVNFYNPMNVLITGLAVSDDRIFIATPKLFSGVPSTLNYVSKQNFGDSPLLQAYPNWSFSNTGRNDFNCSDLALISVFRMRIDSCNRLWALDSGVSRALEDFEKTCPPKILVIDLNTNQVVRRIDFPQNVTRGESLFTNLVVDETTSKTGTCDDVFVYITDTVEPAIIVYDSEREKVWRLTHSSMFPDPDFFQTEILGQRIILMDGVVGLAFDAKAGIVYFQPLATDRIFSVTKESLRAGPLPANTQLPVKTIGMKSSQGIGLAVSPIDGSLLFNPTAETSIISYNPTNNHQAVLAYDRDRLQFITDITTTPSEPGVAYAIASKFQRFFLKNINPNEFNNHIVRLELLTTGSATQFNDNNLQSSALPLSQYQSNALVNNFISQQPSSFRTIEQMCSALRNPYETRYQGESFAPHKDTSNFYENPFITSAASNSYTLNIPVSLSRGYHYNRPQNKIFTT